MKQNDVSNSWSRTPIPPLFPLMPRRPVCSDMRLSVCKYIPNGLRAYLDAARLDAGQVGQDVRLDEDD